MKYIITTLTILSLFSCKNDDTKEINSKIDNYHNMRIVTNGEKCTVYLFDSNKNVSAIIYTDTLSVFHDTITESLMKLFKFYNNGYVSEITIRKDETKYIYTYDSLGKILEYGQQVRDKKNSYWFDFECGTLKSAHFYINDSLIGDAYEYYDNNKIKSIAFVNPYDNGEGYKCESVRIFDTLTNKLIVRNGFPAFVRPNDTLDKYRHVLIGHIPNCYYKYELLLDGINDNKSYKVIDSAAFIQISINKTLLDIKSKFIIHMLCNTEKENIDTLILID